MTTNALSIPGHHDGPERGLNDWAFRWAQGGVTQEAGIPPRIGYLMTRGPWAFFLSADRSGCVRRYVLILVVNQQTHQVVSFWVWTFRLTLTLRIGIVL
jgi:hypothetical protein